MLKRPHALLSSCSASPSEDEEEGIYSSDKKRRNNDQILNQPIMTSGLFSELYQMPDEIFIIILGYIESREVINSWYRVSCRICRIIDRYVEFSWSFRSFNDEILEGFLEWKLLKNLISVNLSRTTITDICMVKIASNKDICNLTYLDVSNTELNDISMVALASSEYLKNLTYLKIDSTSTADQGFSEIVKSKRLTNLKTLSAVSLKGCDLLYIPQTIRLTNLKDLNLSQCTPTQLNHLIRMKNLTRLDLRDTLLDEHEFRSFARNMPPKLTWLDISKNGLGMDSLDSLINSPHSVSLTYLAIRACGLTDESVKELVEGYLYNLTDLDLKDNNITDEGVKALSNLTNLLNLTLTDNEP